MCAIRPPAVPALCDTDVAKCGRVPTSATRPPERLSDVESSETACSATRSARVCSVHTSCGVGNDDAARAFPLRGIANGDVLGFSVSFGASGSVASWTGQVDGTQPVTMWHLAREVTDSKEAVDLWGSVVTGSDVFVR